MKAITGLSRSIIESDNDSFVIQTAGFVSTLSESPYAKSPRVCRSAHQYCSQRYYTFAMGTQAESVEPFDQLGLSTDAKTNCYAHSARTSIISNGSSDFVIEVRCALSDSQ